MKKLFSKLRVGGKITDRHQLRRARWSWVNWFNPPSLPQSPEGNLACHKPIHSGALCFILIVLDKTLLVESDRTPAQTSVSKKENLLLYITPKPYIKISILTKANIYWSCSVSDTVLSFLHVISHLNFKVKINLKCYNHPHIIHKETEWLSNFSQVTHS